MYECFIPFFRFSSSSFVWGFFVSSCLARVLGRMGRLFSKCFLHFVGILTHENKLRLVRLNQIPSMKLVSFLPARWHTTSVNGFIHEALESWQWEQALGGRVCIKGHILSNTIKSTENFSKMLFLCFSLARQSTRGITNYFIVMFVLYTFCMKAQNSGRDVKHVEH